MVVPERFNYVVYPLGRYGPLLHVASTVNPPRRTEFPVYNKNRSRLASGVQAVMASTQVVRARAGVTKREHLWIRLEIIEAL